MTVEARRLGSWGTNEQHHMGLLWVIVASVLWVLAAGPARADISPSICWSKKKLSAGLACWCKLKHEFHSGPPGTPEWSIVPPQTLQNLGKRAGRQSSS
jgi:hypothetical protein